MEIEWRIGSDDVKRVKTLIRKQADNALVRARTAKKSCRNEAARETA